MNARLLAVAIFAVMLACALFATRSWQEEKHPLLISSGCAAGPNPCLRMKCEVKPNTRSVA